MRFTQLVSRRLYWKICKMFCKISKKFPVLNSAASSYYFRTRFFKDNSAETFWDFCNNIGAKKVEESSIKNKHVVLVTIAETVAENFANMPEQSHQKYKETHVPLKRSGLGNNALPFSSITPFDICTSFLLKYNKNRIRIVSFNYCSIILYFCSRYCAVSRLQLCWAYYQTTHFWKEMQTPCHFFAIAAS